MIKWTELKNQVPDNCRELIAKNDNKEVSASSSAKKCKVMKFASTFTKERILNVLEQSEITHWAYTD